jgi:hypothetical protein
LEKIAAEDINAAIAAYMVGMLALGFTGARKLHQGEYHLAGRSLNLIILTGTLCATVVGASATVDMATTWVQQRPSRSLVDTLRHGRPYGSIHPPN